MFFNKKSSEGAFFVDLEKSLNKVSSQDELIILDKKLKAFELLSSAAEDCDSIGMYKIASDIVDAIENAENVSSEEIEEIWEDEDDDAFYERRHQEQREEWIHDLSSEDDEIEIE